MLVGSIAAHSWQGRRWLDPFFAELWIWPVYLGYYHGPLSVWVCEVIVGLAVLVWVGMPRRRIRLRGQDRLSRFKPRRADSHGLQTQTPPSMIGRPACSSFPLHAWIHLRK